MKASGPGHQGRTATVCPSPCFDNTSAAQPPCNLTQPVPCCPLVPYAVCPIPSSHPHAAAWVTASASGKGRKTARARKSSEPRPCSCTTHTGTTYALLAIWPLPPVQATLKLGSTAWLNRCQPLPRTPLPSAAHSCPQHTKRPTALVYRTRGNYHTGTRSHGGLSCCKHARSRPVGHTIKSSSVATGKAHRWRSHPAPLLSPASWQCRCYRWAQQQKQEPGGRQWRAPHGTMRAGRCRQRAGRGGTVMACGSELTVATRQ